MNDCLPGKITAEARCAALSNLLRSDSGVRVMEAHSPLCALLIDKIFHLDKGRRIAFDAFWSSSLTDSTMRGKPDIELLNVSERLANVSEIFEVTTKPLIFDADTGGTPEHLCRHIRTAERLGVSAFIIEDKSGLKRNSLLGNSVL